MATMPHESTPPRERTWPRLVTTEMWASLAIVSMWVAVLFDAVFGPAIVSSDGYGGGTTSVPSAVVVALFASLATAAVARRGFRHDR